MAYDISKNYSNEEVQDLIENLLITKLLLMILIGSAKLKCKVQSKWVDHSISVTINIPMKLQKNW